ncbi:uncharacterized protein LOC116296142 [Actinia tenebrosa]|uniref:Uncharacterized protein LOC116296142 n=1 Tax=Actinia tenebrosa TaxID=6105 RepID=A0A6P8I5C9_ACTTE|nr:uncharacterized protein LOC116296142 [Actinia tenebrosa]
MFKELLILAFFVGLASAKIIVKSENDLKKRDSFEPERLSLPKHILEDADVGDPSIFDEKRGADFDKALSIYDYITDLNKRAACTHYFPSLCPTLARKGYCSKAKAGRKAAFVTRFCGWVCNGC